MKFLNSPTTSKRPLRLIWRESVPLAEEILDSWGSDDVVKVDNMTDITRRFALFVISSAVFRKGSPWQTRDDTTTKENLEAHHTMIFIQAIKIVATRILWKMAIPGPLWGNAPDRKTFRVAGAAGQGWLGKSVQTAAVTHSELMNYILLRANEAEGGLSGSGGLNESELIGNIFIFLIAGHEATTHALAFAFGLLALYQDEQEKAYQSNLTVLGPPSSNRPPIYDDMPTFNYILAIFYETLRLFPPVAGIPKRAAEDCVFPVHPYTNDWGD